MSWEADSWASSGGSYSDTLIAQSTLEQSYDDYTGRAVFYKSADEESAVPLDLFINSLQYTVAEHMQFEEMQGNMFSYVAFGKDAMRLNLAALLVDTGKNYGKDTLVDFYRNYLRLEAVARRGTCPILVFPDAAFYCAASSMTIEESGESEDVLTVTMSLEITAACFISTEDSFMLDYVHGAELSEDSILNTELTTASDSSDVSTCSSFAKSAQNSYTSLSVTSSASSSSSSTSSSSTTTTSLPTVDVSYADAAK